MIDKDNIQAVIFDMDGILIDNYDLWRKQSVEFYKQYGHGTEPEGLKEACMGQSMKKGAEIIKERLNLTESVEEIIKIKIGFTDRIYTEFTQPFDGVEELLKKLKEKGMRIALASGASKRRINIILDRFNWHDYFEHAVSSEDVGSVGKPAPDVFLRAASLLGVDPQNCLVFEDAPNGVLAAKSAGMSVVAIPCEDMKDNEIFTQADLFVDSIKDEKISDILF